MRCFHCGKRVGARAFHVDRYPIAGAQGGTYRLDNVVAACARCNLAHVGRRQLALAPRRGVA